MAGKRPRQIQRTTSMSQLGTAVRFSHSRNGGFPSRGQSYPPEQELGHISMEPCPELGEVTVPPLAMEECNSMVIDSSAEESLCTSRTPWPAADMLPSSNRVPVIDGDAFFCFRAHQWNFSAPLYGKDREATHLRHGVFDMGGSAHPAYFLDICYLCSKSLGHGRDVFIYRGDRAFCSVECRHLQIMVDERREKATITGPAEGSVAIMQVGDAASANLVETVAA